MEREKKDILETEFVDTEGLADTIDALGDICMGKAEHLAVNWQDEPSARKWHRLADSIMRLHGKIADDADAIQGRV